MTLQNVSIFFWLHFSLAVIVPDIENLSSLRALCIRQQSMSPISMVCNVQFGDRRLHRMVVDHLFVTSFGKCRKAHGLVKIDIYCLQGASICIQETF